MLEIMKNKMYNKFSFYSIVVQTVAPEFFIDVSNCTCCILMTKEISTGHHREMLQWRI